VTLVSLMASILHSDAEVRKQNKKRKSIWNSLNPNIGGAPRRRRAVPRGARDCGKPT
jgi:hypothetical protein